MSKAAKHRVCPAVQREISAAECGESRSSRYACPSSCAYSPFASARYSALLELEGEVDRKTMERVEKEKKDQPALRKMAQKISTASLHARHAFYEQILFFRRDAQGLSLAERWRREGFSGMKNDERVLMEAKMRTRIALLEIHRIIDNEQFEAVDLLETGRPPMLLRDRSLAAQAVRFATAVVWLYPLPHYWRLSGTAIILPKIAQLEADEILHETVRHLGGPATEPELRNWLVENFVQVDESLQATGRMRRLQTVASMDAQFGKAVYELRAPFAVCRDVLDAIPEVEPDSLSEAERNEGFADARVWLASQDSAGPTRASSLLGRVLLGQSHWRLECVGAERMAVLRRQFEEAMGERVRFAKERLDDLSSKLAQNEPSPDLALIPPMLLEQPEKIILGTSRIAVPPAGASLEEIESEQRARHHREFLDNPIPALDGQTPRAAAKDAPLRPKLVRLMKQRVRQTDEDNLRTGRNEDINWMLLELGLTEILFDAPPPRAKLPARGELPGMDPDDFIDDDNLPLPTLPAEPLSFSEVSALVTAIMDELATAGEALDYLDACGSMFIDDAASLCASGMEPEEFDLFIPSLIQARFALVPRGFREPDWNYPRLESAYHQTLDRLCQQVSSSNADAVKHWMDHGRQPFLTQFLALQLLQAFQELPKKERPNPDAEFLMLVTLGCMIDELDQSIRE